MAELGLSGEALDRLLVETSRTFALAIPLLSEPTRRTVGIAYLLFRVADTLEDAEAWSRSQRAAELECFSELLRGRGDAKAAAHRWSENPPLSHEGYLRLLALTPELLEAFEALGSVTDIVREHTLRTTLGMRDVLLASQDDSRKTVRLTTLEELRQYCYTVAGIVGELLTDIFVHDAPSLRVEKDALRREERLFGEGLQLVNILKDEADDASEDRVFIPAGVEKSTLFSLARADLEAAARYVAALERGGAPAGMRAFTGLPLSLARDALDAIETRGAGAKVSRERVLEVFGKFRELAESL